MRIQNIWTSLVVALGILWSVQSVAASMWQEGQHYSALPYPVATNDPGKIEVREIFWYGCPHCYEFAKDYLPEWEENLPEDVNFVLMPATFPNWLVHAKAFFAAEALGVVDKLHGPLFDAIAVNPRKYQSTDDFKELFAKYGVSAEDYEKTFEASGFRKISKVDESVNKANELIRAYRLTGVPALIVNGKYLISVSKAGNYANMLKITNYLVDQERQKMASKAE